MSATKQPAMHTNVSSRHAPVANSQSSPSSVTCGKGGCTCVSVKLAQTRHLAAQAHTPSCSPSSRGPAERGWDGRVG